MQDAEDLSSMDYVKLWKKYDLDTNDFIEKEEYQYIVLTVVL